MLKDQSIFSVVIGSLVAVPDLDKFRLSRVLEFQRMIQFWYEAWVKRLYI